MSMFEQDLDTADKLSYHLDQTQAPPGGVAEPQGRPNVEEEVQDVLLHRIEVGMDGGISSASSRIVHTGAAVMSVLGLRCVPRCCLHACFGDRGHV